MPQQTDDSDLAYWAPSSIDPPERAVFSAPDDPEDCTPCSAIVTRDDAGRLVVRVKWQPTRAEAMTLVDGGAIWLSTWHGLPAHMLEVAPPPGGQLPSVIPEQVADLLPEFVQLRTEDGDAWLCLGHWPVWLVEAAVLVKIAEDQGLYGAEAARSNGLTVSTVWAAPIEPLPGGAAAGGAAWTEEPRADGSPATLVRPA